MHSHKTIGVAAILLGLSLHAAAAQQVAATAPADIVGAFDTLSPGNKSIAESLYTAQTGPVHWTRDQIATAKLSGDGWGQIFQEMKRDGLVTEKSLGQVVRRDAAGPAALRRHEVVVTTATGASRVVGTGHAHAGRGNGASPITGNGGTGNGARGAPAVSSALGGGAAMAGNAAGHGGGHGNGMAVGRNR